MLNSALQKMSLAVLTLALSTPLLALPTSWEGLDQKIADRKRSNMVKAVSIAVGQNGNVLYNSELGYRDAESNKKTNSDTLYYSASMSKMLTATAILQMSENGLLDLNQPILNYLPWFRRHPSPQAHRITIRQILSHMSGLSRENGIEFWTNAARSKNGLVPQEAELREAAVRQAFAFPEGTRLRYSNLGFELLGQVVGSLCRDCRGRNNVDRYIEYVSRHILAPLSMNRSTFKPSLVQQEQIAQPYGMRDHEGADPEYFPVFSGTGASAPAWGLVSNALDFMKFMTEIGYAAQGKPTRLFRTNMSSLIAEPVAWDPGNPGRGHSLGFMVLKSNKGLLIGHSGTFLGYSNAGYVSLSDGMVAVAYTNSLTGGGSAFVTDALEFSSQLKLLPQSATYPPFELPAYDGERYYLVQWGNRIPLYLFRRTDGIIAGRIGTNGPYLSWLGDEIQFKLAANGQVESMLVSGATRSEFVRK